MGIILQYQARMRCSCLCVPKADFIGQKPSTRLMGIENIGVCALLIGIYR